MGIKTGEESESVGNKCNVEVGEVTTKPHVGDDLLGFYMLPSLLLLHWHYKETTSDTRTFCEFVLFSV